MVVEFGLHASRYFTQNVESLLRQLDIFAVILFSSPEYIFAAPNTQRSIATEVHLNYNSGE